MKRKALSMTAMAMAAVTALTSTSICVFAEGQDSKALAAAITTVKSRLDIPEELSEFTYNTFNRYLNDTYSLTWHTPDTAKEYKSVSVTVRGSLITSYSDGDEGWEWGDGESLAKLSGDELYDKAKAAVKKLNPTVAGVIDIDRDSLRISLHNQRARFTLVRTKDGVPVKNDSGDIVLDKNTGELLSFNIGWHEKAAFQKADGALPLDKAKEKYAEVIDLQPQYEVYYDWDSKKTTARLVYTQNYYGEINAFTGEKSNFTEDGYYETTNDAITEEAGADKVNPATGGGDFTEQERAELDKDLPYAGEEAVKKLLQSDPYLTYQTDMVLESSDLYKVTYGKDPKYYYTASFTTKMKDEIIDEPETVEVNLSYEEEMGYTVPTIEEPVQNVRITVDAETGQIISYYYYDGGRESRPSYDMAKADKLAEEIAKKYTGDKFEEFRDYSSNASSWATSQDGTTRQYDGSYHNWTRYANDIKVANEGISISFNADMKLRRYSLDYTDVELPDPKKMLTSKQVMDKFWENNELDLYYLAAFNEKVTKTVLVYGADWGIYADAFTGMPVYGGSYGTKENDLSGIKDKKIKKMAQTLSDHGFTICDYKFSEKDEATEQTLRVLLGDRSAEDEDCAVPVTRGEALVIFTEMTCGKTIPAFKGIYKSPFSDVSDNDKNVGYYALAYGMGVVSGKKLNPDEEFTMGDMIKMVYTLYSNGKPQ